MQGVCVAKMQAASKAKISQIMPFRLAENVKKSEIASHEFVDSAQNLQKLSCKYRGLSDLVVDSSPYELLAAISWTERMI